MKERNESTSSASTSPKRPSQTRESPSKETVKRRTNIAKDDDDISALLRKVQSAETGRRSRPEIPTNVFVKLVAFTLLMLVVPLGLFYVGQRYLFHGNVMYSSILAIVAVNLILFGYVAVAFLEDDEEPKEGSKNQKRD